MASATPALNDLDVDFVISYRVPPDSKKAAVAQFKKLIRCLAEVGLQTEVRAGDETSVLVFVRASDEKAFGDVVYRSRIKDWLNAVRQAQPDRDTQKCLTVEPLHEAERFRLVHNMICADKEEGGAAILPKTGEWENVEAIFPLQNHTKNKQWLNDFSRKTFLTPEDLDHIRDGVGEKIAYYYAFLQSYFTFMMFPAAFGFSCWVLLGHYSSIYAIVNGLWCVVFVEWWKRQEFELAFRWGVRGVSAIEDKRKDFQYEKEVKDPITGETVKIFPATTRLYRQLLQIPFALLAVTALGTVIATCFGIEIFISEIYDGPLKSVLTFLPTILLTTLLPMISTNLTGLATRLTVFENYETQDAYDKAMVAKLFVLNFVTSYLPIFLTAFVYVPFAATLVPYLDIFSLTVRPFAEDEKQMQTPSPAAFKINPDRLKNQVIYFSVTAQIVNFAMETIVPLVLQKGKAKYSQMQAERAEKKGGAAAVSANDPAEEREFLNQVRAEAALPDYDVQSDLREMVVQFGLQSCFSVVWPLMPVAFLINNWIELRGDTFKLTMESKRPSPQRADSIGPWLDSLGFLAWLGSVTSAALVYIFSNDGLGPDGRPTDIKLWALLLTVFFSEHIYIVVRLAVRTVVGKLDSENKRKERAERYMVRKRYLEEAGITDNAGQGVVSPPSSPLAAEDAPGIFNRQSLENDARESSLRDSTPVTRFWGRQKGWSETEKVGLRMIEMMDDAGNETKKTM